jgi:DNA polymerase-3 subunit gamma/tau
MSYLVLARKYRPQTFDDVVEQSHITKTLSNAIVADRVAHALLFTGPRGTGKTTIARIVAKALNCGQGPTPRPCNQCESCLEITSGSAADVFEIDGASNNSVDQIRELRENIPYMPSKSRSKIYIIDEVHMLSIAAFNALLKILEEPPAHILFLFATTEPQKIPITILSRCQRHDMRRISTAAILKHLTFISQKEGFELSEKILAEIAREADGSMRDALSLLDQVLSCSDGAIESDQILGLFGIIDRSIVFDLASAVLNQKMVDIIDIIHNVYQRGQDMRKFYTEILDHFRNLLIIKLGHHVDTLVDLPGQEIDLLKQQSLSRSAGALSQIFDFLFKEEPTVRLATQPKMALEIIFFRLLKIKPTLSIDELILGLDALRSDLPEPSSPLATKIEDQKTDVINKSGAQDDAVESRPLSTSKEKMMSKSPNRRGESMQPEVPGTALKRLRQNGRIPSDKIHHPNSNQGERGNAKSKGTLDNDISISEKDLWQQLVSLVQKKKPSMGSVITKCRLIHIKDDCLYFKIEDNGYAVRVIKKNLPQLTHWCQQLAGKAIDVKFKVSSESENGKQKKNAQNTHLKRQALSHPVVLDAIEVFNGKVTGIKILSGGKKL